MLDALLLISLAASCFMAGLIWFVQVVHYPLLAAVGDQESAAYVSQHQNRTTMVVAPVMLIELVSAIAASAILLGNPGVVSSAGLVHASLALLAVVWISTFGIQVPLHTKLLRSRDAKTITSLVRTNWVRTIGWSARTVLLAIIVIDALPSG